MKTSFELNSGYSMPALGFGTWKIPNADTTHLVEEAIAAGYRHIDCAMVYGNEKEVGRGLKSALEGGDVKRSDLFITSKLWNSKHFPKDVRPALLQSMEDKQCDYLDLYLIHWPVALKEGHGFPAALEDLLSLDDCPLIDTWREMEKAVDDGLVRSIGVSNFSAKKLHELKAQARIPPAVNQVECHPYLQLEEMHAYCKATGVHLTGFSPMGSPDRPDVVSKEEKEPLLLEEPTVHAIAKKHSVSPAQVLLNWAIACDRSVLCKASARKRLDENVASLTALTLDDDDMAKLKTLNQNRRYINGSFWCAENGPYTLENLWDESTSVESLLKQK